MASKVKTLSGPLKFRLCRLPTFSHFDRFARFFVAAVLSLLPS
jgi:hypothetical protein